MFKDLSKEMITFWLHTFILYTALRKCTLGMSLHAILLLSTCSIHFSVVLGTLLFQFKLDVLLIGLCIKMYCMPGTALNIHFTEIF